MQLFGYERLVDETLADENRLLELQEASFKASPDDVRRLASFLCEVAAKMERAGSSFGHLHFKDYCKEKGIAVPQDAPDIIVCG